LEHPRLTDHDVVYADNVEGSYNVVRYLIELGHRRIAHITINSESIIVKERYEGYRKALEEANIKSDERLVKVFPDKVNEDQALEELMSLEDPPTTNFTFSDFMAIQTMKALIKMGYRIPNDIYIIVLDDVLQT